MSMLLKLYLVKYNVPNKLKNLIKFHYILASSVHLIYTRGKLTMSAKRLEGGGTTRRNVFGVKRLGEEMVWR